MYNPSMPPPPPAYSSYNSGSAPASKEAYGSVSYSYSVPQQQTPQQTRRRQTDATPTPSYYHQNPGPPPTATTTTTSTGMYPPSSYSPSPIPQQTQQQQQQQSKATTFTYQHNVSVLFFLSPVLAILWFHPSAYPLQVFLFVVLALYGVDLANDRDLTVVGIWIAFCMVSATNAWTTFMEIITMEGNPQQSQPQHYYYVMMAVLQISVETLVDTSIDMVT